MTFPTKLYALIKTPYNLAKKLKHNCSEKNETLKPNESSRRKLNVQSQTAEDGHLIYVIFMLFELTLTYIRIAANLGFFGEFFSGQQI